MNKNERIAAFTALMKESDLSDKTIDDITTELNNRCFFNAPASTKYHGAYEGGLFDHSFTVTKELINLTEKLNLTWGRKASPYIIGMFHDLCKCDNYVFNEKDNKYEYNPNILITGHGDKSVIISQQIIPLTTEEILCIRWHMGAYDDKSVWNNLGKAIEEYPNVLYTHTADMIATRIHHT